MDRKLNCDKPNKKKNLIPFIKWAGGKRWLVHRNLPFWPHQIEGRYFEPFVGSAAVFASLRPESAMLSDINEDLINTYVQVKKHWRLIVKGLSECQKMHSKKYFYAIRKKEESTDIKRAIRFLYLNRTCFNGLYRVNKLGKFNVPIGTKNSISLPYDDFEEWSRALKKTIIKSMDFEDSIGLAGKGDLVFADPPYTVSHNLNGFMKYNEVLFSWQDQVRLRDALKRAIYRGAKVISTNANHEAIRNLYSEDFSLIEIDRASTIAASSQKRGRYSEIIILSKGVGI